MNLSTPQEIARLVGDYRNALISRGIKDDFDSLTLSDLVKEYATEVVRAAAKSGLAKLNRVEVKFSDPKPETAIEAESRKKQTISPLSSKMAVQMVSIHRQSIFKDLIRETDEEIGEGNRSDINNLIARRFWLVKKLDAETEGKTESKPEPPSISPQMTALMGSLYRQSAIRSLIKDTETEIGAGDRSDTSNLLTRRIWLTNKLQIEMQDEQALREAVEKMG